MWRIIQTRLREGPPVWLPAVSTLPVVAACVALGRVSSSADAGLAAGVLAAAILSPPLGLVALALAGVGLFRMRGVQAATTLPTLCPITTTSSTRMP